MDLFPARLYNEEKIALLKLLADETRIDILNVLLHGDSYVEKIACELSLTPVSKWENELCFTDIFLLPRIAEIFGVSIDD